MKTWRGWNREKKPQKWEIMFANSTLLLIEASSRPFDIIKKRGMKQRRGKKESLTTRVNSQQLKKLKNFHKNEWGRCAVISLSLPQRQQFKLWIWNKKKVKGNERRKLSMTTEFSSLHHHLLLKLLCRLNWNQQKERKDSRVTGKLLSWRVDEDFVETIFIKSQRDSNFFFLLSPVQISNFPVVTQIIFSMSLVFGITTKLWHSFTLLHIVGES